jgi:aminoglycoside phosphotransferase (APT) family kinase protein
MIDGTRPVRKGEELDAEALGAFLAARVPGLAGPLEITQFPGGHSNLTYLLKAGDRELVLRRPPRGAREIKAGHDMLREHRILAGLSGVWPKSPRPLARADEAESPLGVPFFVMERVRGLILRGAAPEGVDLAPARMRALSEGFVDTLAELHAVDPAAAGLETLGNPDGYVRRQVTGWTERYARAKTDEVPEIDAITAWLAAHVPPSPAPTLIHNDFKYDNLVLDPADPARILAVLDWEMATLGDPVSDLGMALAYWIEPNDPEELQFLRLGLTTAEGNLTRRELVERYARTTGRDVSAIGFHRVLGLFKIAVIAQQIYARYARGLTQDERFAPLGFAVRLLAQAGAAALEARV